MLFGIWPGVAACDLVDHTTPIDVPDEDQASTLQRLRELAEGTQRFYVRSYRSYGHKGDCPRLPSTPADPAVYLGDASLTVDLVAGYAGSDEADPDGFATWIADAVSEVARLGGGKVQVGEEPNVGGVLDGGRPEPYKALSRGLRAALDKRDHHSGPGQAGAAGNVLVGFNAAVALPDDPFWGSVREHVAAADLERIDFLGLDFFPDVFRPVAPTDLKAVTQGLLRAFRSSAHDLGIPDDVAIHVTETGWPTGPHHPEDDQATTLTAVATAALDLADEVNLDTYEWFGLRDGNSTGPRTNRFGILHDDYSPKPAYHAVRQLISAYS